MMNNLLMRLTKTRPMKTIIVNDQPYLERYHMLKVGKYQVWLHRFIRADSERHLHGHPWWAVSIVMTGWYQELYAFNGKIVGRYRRPRSIARITPDHIHRVVDVQPNTWTLMIVGTKRRPTWKFIDDDGITQIMVTSERDWYLTAGIRPQPEVGNTGSAA